MEIKNVAILANTTAGKGKSKQISIWLQEQLINLNKPSTIYDLDWPSEAELNQYSDVWVIGGDGVRNFIAFLNRIGRDGGEILHQIPGAAAIGISQLGHDGEQGGKRGLRRILLRGLGHVIPA